MSYLAIRHLHITFACISIFLFALRGGMQLAGIDWRRWKILKIAPHIIDTGLLVAAIALVVISHQYPWVFNWVLAKIIALFAYIGFGMLALRPAVPRRQRAAYFAAALTTVTYIVAVAITRSATLFLF